MEIGPVDLEVVAARVRPSRSRCWGVSRSRISRRRPAAEWGAEYYAFSRVPGAGARERNGLFPRRDVIVRVVALAGVASKDIEGAIRFQLDSLHPYGEDEMSWGWSPLALGAVLVGIVRRSVADRYIQLFTEAGIGVSGFTFSAAAVHAAIQLNGGAGPARQNGFVALSRTPRAASKLWQEPARPVFSGEFEMPARRAAALAMAELRLPPQTEPLELERVLPKPTANPVENDLARNPCRTPRRWRGPVRGWRHRLTCCRPSTQAQLARGLHPHHGAGGAADAGDGDLVVYARLSEGTTWTGSTRISRDSSRKPSERPPRARDRPIARQRLLDRFAARRKTIWMP